MKPCTNYDCLDKLVAGPLSLIIYWKNNLVSATKLDFAQNDDQIDIHSAYGQPMQAALERLVSGKPALWPDLPLNTSQLSAFSQKVIAALRGIEHGHFITYGDLAHGIDAPKAARAVGRAVGANPWPLYVPCHRVLGSAGRLHGFSSGGLPMKAMLLHFEGHVYQWV